MSEADKIIAELRRIAPLLKAEGVVALSIFGSRARGDHRPDSDLDVLIDVEEGRKFSLIDLASVKLAIEDELEVDANVMTRRSLRPPLLDSVLLDEREVF